MGKKKEKVKKAKQVKPLNLSSSEKNTYTLTGGLVVLILNWINYMLGKVGINAFLFIIILQCLMYVILTKSFLKQEIILDEEDEVGWSDYWFRTLFLKRSFIVYLVTLIILVVIEMIAGIGVVFNEGINSICVNSILSTLVTLLFSMVVGKYNSYLKDETVSEDYKDLYM